MEKKFDICIMNPPYSKNGSGICNIFLRKALDISKHIVTVQPLTWLLSINQPKNITSIIDECGIDIESINTRNFFDAEIVGNIAIQYINTAIDINSKKIVPKVKKEPIFIPIIARISIPFNIENLEEKENKLEQKELRAKEHLENMFEITRNLGYNDIKLLKNRQEGINYNIEKEQNDWEEDYIYLCSLEILNRIKINK